MKGALWRVLPPGVHWTSLLEVEVQYAWNTRRAWLFEGVQWAAEALDRAGCRAMYLNGSFVTDKPEPADFDACWDARGVDPARLDPILLDFGPGRKRQKRVFRGELFPTTHLEGAGSTFLEFFQRERDTGVEKGLLGLRLPEALGRTP